ncbi:MAG: radical SAM protein [Victivallaceae bacterium]|jgi:7-carboxy-7-deazaguanine synthase
MNQSSILVTETFLSIQGESTHAGRLCFFIRLAGCNLKCRYCDTRYSASLTDGKAETLELLVVKAVSSDVDLVEITGGEPLTQPATIPLCEKLLDAGMTVLVETNGSMPIRELPAAVIRILDCKTPSSGESGSNLYKNYDFLTPADEIKFVISDREDYDFSRRIIREYDLAAKTRNLLFSPVWGKIEPRQLAAWMIADRPPARLQLQMHKLIWGPEKTGV